MRSVPFPRLLHHTLVNTALARPEGVALVSDGQTYTYRELLAAALALASTLERLGVRRGDRVALYLENGWQCCVAVYASLFLGAVFLVINPQTKADKLAFVLDDSGAKVLITQGHLMRTFVPIIGDRASLLAVIYTGSPPPLERTELVSFEEATSAPPLASASPTIPLDLAALVYTSGTTGSPKGVMLTHHNMLFTAGSIAEYLELDREQRILNVLPMAFTYGLYQLLVATLVGATLVLERSFTYPARVLERVEQERVTVFPGVPSIYALLISMHAKSPLSLPSVRTLTNAAAALPNSHVQPLRQVFPNARLYPMYGQTECARGCYLDPALVEEKPGSVGRAIPGTELLVLSPEGEPVPVGEPGILHIRGPHVMLGYWKRPDETNQALKPGPLPGERMLCTKDWFKVDADGCHYFVGRSDDIIKTRGEKVSPLEVENVLYAIPGVKEAAVVGVPDDFLGQAVRAHIVLEEGICLAETEILAVCRQRLENFMVPRDIRFETELPKTQSGKIRKKDLTDRALAEARPA